MYYSDNSTNCIVCYQDLFSCYLSHGKIAGQILERRSL